MKDTVIKAGRTLFRMAFRKSAARTAVCSFAVAILLGAIVLTLPFSSQERRWTAPVDALFTSTSAVCVTGLLVKSTPGHWSTFGELTILALIQAGGLGIMTMGAVVFRMFQRRVSMRFEVVMQDIVDANGGENIWFLLRFMCVLTVVAEAAGAVALYFCWRGNFASGGACLYHSIFHSVSAFCNAGFSLNDDSLMAYVDSVGINTTICLLVVIGGIGFPVVRDLLGYVRWHLFRRKGRRVRLTTHSKLVLSMTAILLAVGFVTVFVLESHGSLTGAPLKTRLLASVFQSVTPRTAGFNTVDMAALAPATALLTMALMYIGGSPSGTAGGIKTSTLGIMIASIVATLKGRSKAELFHHSVAEETVHRVASIILLSVALLTGGIFLLLVTENAGGAEFMTIAFDAISAFGTVGLSVGLTGPDTTMSAAGKLIITVLMFAGRLGPITLVLGVAQMHERGTYRYPEDQILVG